MLQEGGHSTKVTVIIPTYNRARQVGAAIDSVLSQTGADLDVVIVDDGSTDDTAAVLSHRRDPRVRILKHRRNRGVTAAKNTGLDAVPDDTDWFGILDSDDMLAPNAVRGMLAAASGAEPQPSQIIGWCVDAATGNPTGRVGAHESLVTYQDALCGRFEGEFWHLARRDLLGSHRFEERGSGGEASLWWSLLRESPGLLVPEVVRLYDQSGQDRISITRYTTADARSYMWARHAVLAAVGKDMIRICPRRYGIMVAEMSKWAAFAGERRIARRSARQALRYAPSLRSLAFNALALAPMWFVQGLIPRAARLRDSG